MNSGEFHPILKQSVISPLLKNGTLDNDLLSIYCPISNLLSKIIERVVKSRLTHHLSSNNLLIQISLLTANIIPLKLLSYIYMII